MDSPPKKVRRVVVFDLGVLIDWNPRHLYRRLFDDEEAMEAFLAGVCTPEWNQGQDAGRPIAEAVATLQASYPSQAPLIAAYYDRWPEMLAGAIDDTVAVLADLKDGGVPLYALTNWSAETFPVARERFEFLSWFDGTVVSGAVGLIKPDRRIFEHLLDTHGISADEAVFIDDSLPNVAAARAMEFAAIHFKDAGRLRADLEGLGLI